MAANVDNVIFKEKLQNLTLYLIVTYVCSYMWKCVSGQVRTKGKKTKHFNKRYFSLVLHLHSISREIVWFAFDPIVHGNIPFGIELIMLTFRCCFQFKKKIQIRILMVPNRHRMERVKYLWIPEFTLFMLFVDCKVPWRYYNANTTNSDVWAE